MCVNDCMCVSVCVCVRVYVCQRVRRDDIKLHCLTMIGACMPNRFVFFYSPICYPHYNPLIREVHPTLWETALPQK